MCKNEYLNEDGFPEFKLACGCISTNIPGFGWTTTYCEEHEESYDEDLYNEPKLTKFKPNQHY